MCYNYSCVFRVVLLLFIAYLLLYKFCVFCYFSVVYYKFYIFNILCLLRNFRFILIFCSYFFLFFIILILILYFNSSFFIIFIVLIIEYFTIFSLFFLLYSNHFVICCTVFFFLIFRFVSCKSPANIYSLKFNNINTRRRCVICSKLTIKTPKRRCWLRSGVLIVNFEHILHLSPVFLLLTLNK